jgi:hydroxymethylglutaryl-CoA reductase (NADPH)
MILTKVDRVPKKIKSEDYSMEAVKLRQEWLSERKGLALEPITHLPYVPEMMRKNIENLIGSMQIPLGVAGPIEVHGEHANGLYYVPFATTQGTMLESYHRGMNVITLSGGAQVRIEDNKVDITPVFLFNRMNEAPVFIEWVRDNFESIRKEAESTTRYGKLLSIQPRIIGRRVYLTFAYSVGDASGLNMINIASYKACEYIKQAYSGRTRYYLRSNMSSDKKPSYFNLIQSYGKRVTADAVIPAKIIKKNFQTTPEQMRDFWFSSIPASFQGGMIGTNAHYANGLAAIFIATGQDIAQIVNASMGIGILELTEEGDLYISATLPCLIVATVGGGTGLPHQKKCLEIMDCAGEGKVEKLAEIIAATLLGGEISIMAALSNSTFAEADIRLRGR